MGNEVRGSFVVPTFRMIVVFCDVLLSLPNSSSAPSPQANGRLNSPEATCLSEVSLSLCVLYG